MWQEGDRLLLEALEPDDVHSGRREAILAWRNALPVRSLVARRDHDRKAVGDRWECGSGHPSQRQDAEGLVGWA